MLCYPHFDQPFLLDNDVSKDGLGAVLYQKQDSLAHVVTFASRSVNDAEKDYHSSKLEFLALMQISFLDSLKILTVWSSVAINWHLKRK